MTKVPCEGVDATKETRTRMRQQLMDNTVDDPLEVTRYFRHLVSCVQDPPFEEICKEIVSAGCVPKFVHFLQMDRCLEVQKEAAWVLGNMSGGDDDISKAMFDAGVVAPMISLINSENSEVGELSAQCLANIVMLPGVCEQIAGDVFKPLLPLLAKDEVPPNASALLRNLCGSSNPHLRLSILRPCLPTLIHLISNNSVSVSDDACNVLAHLIRIHGSRLSPSLDSSFFTEFHNLHKMNPDRKSFTNLAHAVRQKSMAPSSPSQDEGSSSSTKGPQYTSQCNSTPTSLQCNSKPSGASSAFGRRRARSTSPDGVSTRSTPKRTKISTVAVCLSPTKPRTRAFSKRFVNIAPNHSASYISQKKDELFRAVAEGELERVEQLVHHTGPSVTKGRRECTLLHVAAENNQPSIVLFLLQFISPNVVNHDGHTPAHLAAMKGHTQVLHILLSDPHINPDKRDLNGNIYTHWLVSHLLEAVLKEDVTRVRSLLSVGADVDKPVRGATGGALARELHISSIRHLARVLQHESILRVFDAERRKSTDLKAEACTATQSSTSFHRLPTGTLALPAGASPSMARGPDVYRMDAAPRGYVCILSYGSFHVRPDLHLEGSQTDAYNLANTFSEMGYRGHAHFSLTAGQTRQQLAKVRDMELLERAGCAVFIISSYGEPRRHFLTSDMQTIDIQWVLDFFKDSQCPYLKNKPKLFIWDLCRGHQEQECGRGKTHGELCGRVDEPLRDVMCLDSSSGGFTWRAFSEEGTPFIGALCSVLARHAATKELSELYREFLKEYATAAPDAVPQLTNYGFNKKFYFNPTKESFHA
ncbi:hypothetical protein O3P69_000803 [Scylla paramamosain]|uniref:Uncharacterized protein n=1 Tax=Scylla paramamosain TaxID=85552 RepID=A0AAW0URG2_SCYPA